MSSNRWIISHHRFHEHRSVESAFAEHKRLSTMFPDRRFHVYRVKRTIEGESAIPTEREVYDAMVARLSVLMRAQRGSRDASELDALSDALVAYEAKMVPDESQ